MSNTPHQQPHDTTVNHLLSRLLTDANHKVEAAHEDFLFYRHDLKPTLGTDAWMRLQVAKARQQLLHQLHAHLHHK